MAITPCTFVYPYYNNPGMLKFQVGNWSAFREEVRSALRIIVVDDHSRDDCNPVPILRGCKAAVECYRVAADWPWNMHQCRNLGARIAGETGGDPWLYLSDIDIVLTPEAARTMLSKRLDPAKFYTMERVFAPQFKERKVHPNTFLVRHHLFWKVNGYDLDLTPIGGGGYGGDTEFRRQLTEIARREHLSDVHLHSYGRLGRDGTPAIADADTSGLDRSEWHQRYLVALERKQKAGDMRSVNPVRVSFERTL